MTGQITASALGGATRNRARPFFSLYVGENPLKSNKV